MNGWAKGLLSAVVVFGLAGCADGRVSENQAAVTDLPAEQITAAGTAAPSQSGGNPQSALPAAEELIARIAEAGRGLNSYVQESQSWISTGITPDDKTAAFTSVTTTTTKYILNPLQMYQTGSTMVGDKGPMNSESYLTADGFYMYYDSYWRKMPDGVLEDLKLSAQVQSSPVRRMEQLKTILPYVTVSEEGEEYILSARMSGEQTKDLESFYRLQYSSGPLAAEQLSQVKRLSIEYRVNKLTYWPTGTDDELVTEGLTDEEGTYREVKMKTSIGQYNSIKEIVIPEEALKAEQ
jgi:hypothetical protein